MIISISTTLTNQTFLAAHREPFDRSGQVNSLSTSARRQLSDGAHRRCALIGRLVFCPPFEDRSTFELEKRCHLVGLDESFELVFVWSGYDKYEPGYGR